MIFHTEEYTRRELNLSTSQGKKKKRVFSSIVIFLSVSQKERKRNTLTFLQNGQVDLENTITLLSLMFCSIKSFTGAILLGTSGEGVLARLRLDTTKPMMEKYYIASDQNICSYMIRDYGKNVTLQLPKGAVPRKRPPYLSLGYVTC